MATDLPLLPLGIQTFRTVREERMVYVDKTSFVRDLVRSHRRVFLARPRRFGKSLLLSTLESYFKGEAHLFEGLALSPPEIPPGIPVVRIDLSLVSSDRPLSAALTERVVAIGESVGVTISSTSPPEALGALIRRVAKSGKCAVLVDEYDKPVTTELDRQGGSLEENVRVLRDFYSVLKGEDDRIEFCFITGVSRFSKVSIFSGINNLEDISLDERFAAVCGYTDQEIERCLDPYLEHARQTLGMNRTELLDSLRDHYNGYRFSSSTVAVFNPVSVLRSLSRARFENYWFETATPTFLVERIRKERKEPLIYDSYEGAELGMEAVPASHVGTVDLLYQTGYLTIKDVVRGSRRTRYTLGWPNREVKDAFYEGLVKEYSGYAIEGSTTLALGEALDRHDLVRFFEAFNVLLAAIPYTHFISKESYYHSLLHMVLQMSGVVVHSEKQTSLGRIDIVCECGKMVYLFECKLDGSADAALHQIHDRGYADQYRNGGRTVYLVGVAFSSATRSVVEWREDAWE